MSDNTAQSFRAALGSFATGVTIVTTVDEEGRPVGVTASSFNSVSLDPPLVLWSLAKSSKSFETYCESGHFAIHVLSCHQEDMSNAFARSGEDKFDGVAWTAGKFGSPILESCSARFECETVHQYEGGDHIILVGKVGDFEKSETPPLVFHGGQYAEARPKTDLEEAGNSVDPEEGRFTQDFLLYLLSRAHFQSSRPTRKKLEELNISQAEYLAITILSMNAPASATDIQERLDHTGAVPTDEDFSAMEEKGLIEKRGAEYVLCDKAQQILIETLSVAKAFEDDLLDHFTPGQIADTKAVLKKMIALTGGDVPELWQA